MDSIQSSGISIELTLEYTKDEERLDEQLKTIWNRFAVVARDLEPLARTLSLDQMNENTSAFRYNNTEVGRITFDPPLTAKNDPTLLISTTLKISPRRTPHLIQNKRVVITENSIPKKENFNIIHRLKNWKKERTKTIFETKVDKLFRTEAMKTELWTSALFNPESIDREVSLLILKILNSKFSSQEDQLHQLSLREISNQIEEITQVVINVVSNGSVLIQTFLKRLKYSIKLMREKNFEEEIVKSLEDKIKEFDLEITIDEAIASSSSRLIGNRHCQDIHILEKRKQPESVLSTFLRTSTTFNSGLDQRRHGLLHFFELLEFLDDQLEIIVHKAIGSSPEEIQEILDRLQYWTEREGTQMIQDNVENYLLGYISACGLYEKKWLSRDHQVVGVSIPALHLDDGVLFEIFAHSSPITLNSENLKWYFTNDVLEKKLNLFIYKLLESNVCFAMISSDRIKRLLMDSNLRSDMAELFTRSLLSSQSVEGWIAADIRLKALLEGEELFFGQLQEIFIDILSMITPKASETGLHYIQSSLPQLFEHYGFEMEIETTPMIEIMPTAPFYTVGYKIMLWNAKKIAQLGRRRAIDCLWYLMPVISGALQREWYGAVRIEGPSRFIPGAQEEDLEWKYNINAILSASAKSL